VNICDENVEKLPISDKIKEQFPFAIIISSTNIGKDVGPKLALIDLYLKSKQESEYLIMLQDKISPHLINGEKWKNDLLRIIEPKSIDKIIKLFEKDPNLGIIGSSECISNEYQNGNFNSTNNSILKKYLKQFDLYPADYSFVAGNMFWIRSSIYKRFFNKYNPLVIRRDLEKGNVMDNEFGTNTHSLERIFSWISSNQGYTIKGI
jgi:lipopolysaccharide biosynthesis protein